jgi:hypothetical protein
MALMALALLRDAIHMLACNALWLLLPPRSLGFRSLAVGRVLVVGRRLLLLVLWPVLPKLVLWLHDRMVGSSALVDEWGFIDPCLCFTVCTVALTALTAFTDRPTCDPAKTTFKSSTNQQASQPTNQPTRPAKQQPPNSQQCTDKLNSLGWFAWLVGWLVGLVGWLVGLGGQTTQLNSVGLAWTPHDGNYDGLIDWLVGRRQKECLFWLIIWFAHEYTYCTNQIKQLRPSTIQPTN